MAREYAQLPPLRANRYELLTLTTTRYPRSTSYCPYLWYLPIHWPSARM